MGYQSRIAPVEMTRGHLEITGVQAEVAVDGETTTLTAETNLGPVPISLRLASLSALVTELMQAGRVMLSLQRNRLDKGRGGIEGIMADAPVVADGAAAVCDRTGEITLVFLFADRPPMALRFAAETFFGIRQEVNAELGSRSH